MAGFKPTEYYYVLTWSAPPHRSTPRLEATSCPAACKDGPCTIRKGYIRATDNDAALALSSGAAALPASSGGRTGIEPIFWAILAFLQNALAEMSDTPVGEPVLLAQIALTHENNIIAKAMNGSCESTNNAHNSPAGGASLLEQVTPLARQINCLDIERIANACIEKIPTLVKVRFASLYILDDTSNILHLQKCNHPFLINKIVSLNQNPPSPMVMAVKSKDLILAGDLDTHEKPVIRRSQRPFADNYKTRNCVIVPLICQDRVVGVLNLADKMESSSFDYEDIALIELLGQLIGGSIGNVKLFEKIQRQAMTDGLTGLANHRRFYEILERELWRSRRYGGQISVIMIDIDNLKKINDAYGHRAGDKVIKEISKKITLCIRQVDTAARYGGDEFAIILPKTPLSDALVAAERMVEVVAHSPITWRKEQIGLSISVGLGQYDADISPEEITSRSDQALYMAKQAGKNTVRIFQPAKGYRL